MIGTVIVVAARRSSGAGPPASATGARDRRRRARSSSSPRCSTNGRSRTRCTSSSPLRGCWRCSWVPPMRRRRASAPRPGWEPPTGASTPRACEATARGASGLGLMCGIVGQVRPLADRVDRDRAAGADVRAARASRSGFARHPSRRHVALGIQRLRVIDLETGDQPIYNEDRSVAVVLNGEIYNFRELRAELSARGHTLSTNGDTEVIVHLYEEHGPDCVREAPRDVRVRALGRAPAATAARPRPGGQEAAVLLPSATAC